MSFLLDTNVLSAHFRRPGGVAHRFFQYSGRLYTTNVCLAELYVWAFNRPDPGPLESAIDRLLSHEVAVVEFDRDCARRFGQVRVELRRNGIEVSTTDLMIATVALVHEMTLVTHNIADFLQIPGLELQDWLAP